MTREKLKNAIGRNLLMAFYSGGATIAFMSHGWTLFVAIALFLMCEFAYNAKSYYRLLYLWNKYIQEIKNHIEINEVKEDVELLECFGKDD